MADPRNLRPGEFLRLINSTDAGPVLTEPELRKIRLQAGPRIGKTKAIDLFRFAAYVAGLVHEPQPAAAAAGSGHSSTAGARP